MSKSDKKKIRKKPFRGRTGSKKSGAGRVGDLVRRMEAYASRHQLWRRGDRLLVAVSGGADSTALLQLLWRLARRQRLDLTAVHLDHGLRGESARADRRWVEELADRLGIPCFSGRREVGPVIEGGGSSPEEAPRRVRYDYFREAARETGVGILALGHQADDQAETVLLRLFRGGRPAALAGMLPSRMEGELRVVRPLLSFRREELLAFLEEVGEGFRRDSSNRDPRFLRNRVRHHLLPLLEAGYSPRCRELLVELAEREREREEYLRVVLDTRCRDLIREGPGGPFLDCDRFLRAAPPERGEALRRLLACSGVSSAGRRHFRALERLALGPSGRRYDLPGPAVACREGEDLFISSGREEKSLPERVLEIPGEAEIKEIPARLRIRILPVEPGMAGTGGAGTGGDGPGTLREYFDRERVQPPLTVRSRRPGDRYRPLGMEGRRKVKKLLAESGVPLSRRGLVPVIEDREKIIWLAGHRPHHRCRVREDTREVLEITLEYLRSPEQS